MKIRRTLLAVTLAGLSAVASSVASAQAIHFFAVLRGAHEIPSADANGSGTAMVSFRGAALRTICVTLFVDGIDTPNAAHIHRGGGSVGSGPIVVTLNHPANGEPGSSTRCVGISADLSAQIRSRPYGFYVNVHTEAFPGGAIRGQLF